MAGGRGGNSRDRRYGGDGGKTTFISEIQDQIDIGDGDKVISGGGIGNSPGEVSVTFNVSPDYSFLTLVSMLAPSPDWFVGVSGLDLMENGAWLESAIIELEVYDAGTDDGAEYTSANQDSLPKQPIFKIISPPFLINDKIKAPLINYVISLRDLKRAATRRASQQMA